MTKAILGKQVIVAGALVATMGLTACDSTIFRNGEVGNFEVISLDAKQRLVVSGTRKSDGRHVVCAEPSPDAIVARASYLATSAQRLRDSTVGDVQTTSNDNASLGAGSAESVASIAMRTQSIQLLRDGYYRVCEAYLNDAIDEKAYNQVVCNIDTFMSTLVAIQSITGTVTAPGVAITSTAFKTTTTTAEDGTKTVTTEPAKDASAVFQNITNPASTEAEAKAIEAILENYEKARRLNAQGTVSVCSHPQSFFPPQYVRSYK